MGRWEITTTTNKPRLKNTKAKEQRERKKAVLVVAAVVVWHVCQAMQVYAWRGTLSRSKTAGGVSAQQPAAIRI